MSDSADKSCKMNEARPGALAKHAISGDFDEKFQGWEVEGLIGVSFRGKL